MNVQKYILYTYYKLLTASIHEVDMSSIYLENIITWKG